MSIRLADVNRPSGGIDKLCHLRVDFGLRQEAIVRERQSSVHAAVAFERAVQRPLQLARAEARMDIAPTPEFGD